MMMMMMMMRNDDVADDDDDGDRCRSCSDGAWRQKAAGGCGANGQPRWRTAAEIRTLSVRICHTVLSGTQCIDAATARDVARSVVSVLGTRVSCARRLNRSRCRLGRGWHMWVNATKYKMDVQNPGRHGKRHFWGDIHTHECIAPVTGECACPTHAADKCIRRCEGWTRRKENNSSCFV